MALTVLAAAIFIAERATNGPMPAAHVRPGLTRLVGLTAIAIFAQMLLGSWVTGHHAGLAYADFPLMNGALLPAVVGSEQAVHPAHRPLSVVVAALVIWTAIACALDRRPLPRRLAMALVVLVASRSRLAGSTWSRGCRPSSSCRTWPLAPRCGAARSGSCSSVRRLRSGARVHARRPGASGVVDTARAYVALTKPRIIELLLVTTVPTMVLAAGWRPHLAHGGGGARRNAGRRRGERDQHVRRPRHRRPHAADPPPAPAAPRRPPRARLASASA